jgi:Spy/CpxP family protein refolding chaperone
MKTPPFLLIGCPVIIVVAGLTYALTYPSLHRTAFHAALIDAERPSYVTDEADPNAPVAGLASRAERIQWAFTQLGLTDVQKEQIEKIRETVPDHQQRRAAIMSLLTPEQRARWQQIRDGAHPVGSPSTSSNAAPATPSLLTNRP